MSKVRVLVGTRKGAFILTSDGKRDKWDVSGPHFAGWEMYHIKGSPADPNRIYASQTSGWFGQIIQRSDDGGKTWHQPGTPPGEAARSGPAEGREQQVRLRYVRRKRQAAYDSSVVRRDAASVGVQAGVASGAIAQRPRYGLRGRGRRRPFPLDRRRRELEGTLRPARPWHRAQSGSRARAGCACTPSFSIPATRSASTSLSRRPGHSAPMMAAKPGSRSTAGCDSQYIPDPNAEIGHCVHHVAMHPVAPGRALHAEALGRDAQRRCRRFLARSQRQSCRQISDFVIDVHAHEPETIYVVPIKSDSEHYVHEGKLRVFRSRTGGNEWEALTKGLPQSNCYVNVLRDAMASRFAGRVWRLFRHQRWTGLRFGRCRR